MSRSAPESLRELYTERGYGQLKLAAYYGVDRHQIRLWLAELQIPSRPKGGGGAGRPARPSSSDLRRLYLDENKTLKEIGRHYDVSAATARRWLTAAGVERTRRRSPHQRGWNERIPAPPRPELVELYELQRLSAEQIAERYRVSGHTVARWLDDLDLGRLPGSTSVGSKTHLARRAQPVAEDPPASSTD